MGSSACDDAGIGFVITLARAGADRKRETMAAVSGVSLFSSEPTEAGRSFVNESTVTVCIVVEAYGGIPLIAGTPLWAWATFLSVIVVFLALDLGVFHRKAHKVEMKEALIWTGVWIALALLFNVAIFIWWPVLQPESLYTRQEAGLVFLTGYLVEKALSVDNIFVFLVIFSYFAVPEEYRHRVLFWGILGAVFFRAIFIGIGAALLQTALWLMVPFGLFLVYTGFKMVKMKDKHIDMAQHPVVKTVSRWLPVTREYHGQRFFVRINGKLWATPLLVVLACVEFTDIIFAIDSIPAIFAITHDPFLVFTSNIFAILGLRAMFFAVAGLVQWFIYLPYGLAAVLVFVGGKMIYNYAEKAIIPDWNKFPAHISLIIIAGLLGTSIILSIIKSRQEARETSMP